MKQASVEKAHAKLSASGSERWLNCPGSISLSENAPPQGESEYAAEGTDAHACLEFLLKNRLKLTQALKMAKQKWSDEMIEYAKQAVFYILTFARTDDQIICETKVDLSFVAPDMFGTVDAAVIDLFGTLWIFDYKYGAGVAVDPDENTQLIYYALGIAHKYGFNFEDVVLVVIQPRAEHERGPYREWRMSIEDLMAWEKKFRDGVEACDDPLAALTPGDWCRWCPAKTICPSISDLAIRQAQIDFAPEESSEIALPVPNMIKPQTLSNMLNGIEKLETWIEAVKEHALFVMERGAQVPGFKLVKKRSTRKWKDVETIAQEAKQKYGPEAFTTPELKSPAQFEKSFDAIGLDVTKWVAKRVTNESSGVTLVREDDSRPAYNAIEAEFSEIVEGSEESKMLTQMGVNRGGNKKVKTTKKRIKSRRKNR